MSCIETFHLWLRKPPVHEPLKVGSAFWRVILYVFSAFLLYTTYSVLAILGQDTELDGPVIWLGMSRFMFLSVTFKVVYACVCTHLPYPFKEARNQTIKNQLESLICAPQVLILQVLFQAGKKFKQLDWKNDFLILQDPSILKIKLINMEHSLWKSEAFIWELSYVSSFQSQYNGLAVLKIQPNLNKHQVGNSSDARWLLKSRTKLWRSVSPSY